MKYLFLSISFLFCVQLFFGQTFYKNKTNRALTFKELKSQFNDFKNSNDLTKQKHWKNYSSVHIRNKIFIIFSTVGIQPFRASTVKQ